MPAVIGITSCLHNPVDYRAAHQNVGSLVGLLQSSELVAWHTVLPSGLIFVRIRLGVDRVSRATNAACQKNQKHESARLQTRTRAYTVGVCPAALSCFTDELVDLI